MKGILHCQRGGCMIKARNIWSIDRTSFGPNCLVISPLTTAVLPFLSLPCSSSMTSVVRISVAEHVDCFVDGFRQAFCWSRAATLIHSQVDRSCCHDDLTILYCISQIAYCTALLDQDSTTERCYLSRHPVFHR